MKKEVKQTGEKKPGFFKKVGGFFSRIGTYFKEVFAGPAKKNLSDIPLLLSALLH